MTDGVHDIVCLTTAFVRLFYHSPSFAIMDEATSALDEPLEAQCLRRCIHRGISYVSVGHRPSLLVFHSHLLTLGRGGKFTFEPLPPPASDSGALCPVLTLSMLHSYNQILTRLPVSHTTLNCYPWQVIPPAWHRHPRRSKP